MNRKIVYLAWICMFCCSFVYSQTEKTNKTVIKDNQLYYVHEVIKGQTLYGLSKMYNVSVEEITVQNPSVKQGLKIGEHLHILASKLKVELYSVKRGETLYSIAKNRNITEQELLALNPGMEKTLSIEQEIVVPQVKIIVQEEEVATSISSQDNLTRKQKKTLAEEQERQNKETESVVKETPPVVKKTDSVFHVVELGETLYRISRKYGVTVSQITQANPEIGETISIGQRIYIPIEKPTLPQQPTREGNKTPEKENVVIKEGVSKKEYTVFVLIPLYLAQVDGINPAAIKTLVDYKKIKAFDFVQFYEAMLLATEDISAKYPKIKINLYVEDVSSTALTESLIASGKLDNADLIIGPFHAKEFASVCQYAKNKDIILVNPFSEAFEFCGTPVYKGTASAILQGEAFARYVLEKYPSANIIFASYQSEKENKQIADYKLGLRTIFEQSGRNVSMHDANLKSGGISAIKSAMSSVNENFVFTFFEGELSVTNFTQSLNAAKLDKLNLVAPETWLEYDNIETEYFMNLKTHYIASHFVNYSNPKVIRFIDAFRNAYDTEPTLNLYAFQGYDFTYYFLSKLCETGTSFRDFSKDENLLSTKFHFVPSSRSSSVLENSHVHIFKLKDYKYIDAYSDDLQEVPKPRRR